MSMMTASTLTAKCDYVRFSVADLHGILRGKTVPVRHADRILRDGAEVYSGTVRVSQCGERWSRGRAPDCRAIDGIASVTQAP